MQEYIPDEKSWVALGNMWCFLGMALTTFFCWPLPMLHGRKPYVVGGLAFSLVLLFAQATAVSSERLENITGWRIALLVTRGVMGACLACVAVNSYSTLTDLFGASVSPARRSLSADDNDQRRRGGGLGIWLGIYTWCWISSTSLGFGIGGAIAEYRPPTWGFYLSILILLVTLILNVALPDTRGSLHRKVVSEMRARASASTEPQIGEVMLHRVNRSPIWWGQEVYHGVLLSLEMLRQPGFLVLAVYTGWVYAQVVLTTLFLASLLGVYSVELVHLEYAVFVVAAGALASIPFQQGNFFSRSRYRHEGSRGTEGRLLVLRSHPVRRAAFALSLPLLAMGYAITSNGPPTPIAWPTAVAAFIGFFGCLVVSESSALVMEAFDLSGLGLGDGDNSVKDYPFGMLDSSSLTRVTAGLMCFHTVGFSLAAVTTAVGSVMRGSWEQRITMWVAAGILMFLSLLFLFALFPFREVRVEGRPETWPRPRRPIVVRLLFMEDGFKPGNLNDKARMSVFGLGAMTRWTFLGRETTTPAQSPDTITFMNLPRPLGPVLTTSHGGEEIPGTTGDALGTTVIRNERSRSANGWHSTSKGYPGNAGTMGRGLDRTGSWMRQQGAKTARARDIGVVPLRS